jgi:hypothetical protein
MAVAPQDLMKRAPLAQGLFFLGMGLWPLVHLKSFMFVTGPKEDDWLVRTIGALSAVIGGALLAAAIEEEESTAVRTLAIGSSMTFIIADIVYVSKGRISPVYLANTAAQLGLLTGWLRR